MINRLNLAASSGCDAVDPDNVDAYGNKNGLDLTQADSISFMNFLSTAAHTRNLSIGLKNAGEIIGSVLNEIDFAVNEQCIENSECSTWQPVVEAGKPVFHIEYPSDAPSISAAKQQKYCDGAGEEGFATLLKNMDLDDWVEYC